MRALGIIAGLAAGLSAAHAAEKDDLVSVFKMICMSSKPFAEAMADFGNRRGWKVEVRPVKVTGPDSEERFKRSPKLRGYATPPNYRAAKNPVTVFVSLGEEFEGLTLETCTVHQDGRRMARTARRAPSILGLSVSLPAIPQDVRRSFGVEGPGAESKTWSLKSDRWDYVILDETTHMRLQPSTYLTRVKSSN